MRKPATGLTALRNREAAASLPPHKDEDFAEATRGLVAAFEPATVAGEKGDVVWDLESYDAIDAQPSLRRIITSST